MNAPIQAHNTITLDVTQKTFLELEAKLLNANRRDPIGPTGSIDLSGVSVRKIVMGSEDHKHTCKNRASRAMDSGDTIGELRRAWGIEAPARPAKIRR